MANCSIYGCHSSQRPEYAGIGIYKVPSGNDEFKKNWREKLVLIITKDRGLKGESCIYVSCIIGQIRY